MIIKENSPLPPHPHHSPEVQPRNSKKNTQFLVYETICIVRKKPSEASKLERITNDVIDNDLWYGATLNFPIPV